MVLSLFCNAFKILSRLLTSLENFSAIKYCRPLPAQKRPILNLFSRFCWKPAVCVSPEYPVVSGSVDLFDVPLGNPVDWTHGIWSGSWSLGGLYHGNYQVHCRECVHTTALRRGGHTSRICQAAFYVLL